ncbi:MAG TPA: hypothetical protein EYQ50_21560 [Verrucomicrobiales bacterium]|nr:hypothetical protein [Verrucomicrobiales bacterium]HIL68305.1 hypothetical protein [Verrucomicrobiota bacterium]
MKLKQPFSTNLFIFSGIIAFGLYLFWNNHRGGYPKVTQVIPVQKGAFEPGRRNTSIDRIVLFTTEHPIEDAIHLWKTSQSISGHYLISQSGDVLQFVSEADTAYHTGNLDYNLRSIGIAVEGYANPDHAENRFGNLAWQTEPMMNSLIDVIGSIAERHDIPMDREHLIGKNQIPGVTCNEFPESSPRFWGGASGRYSPGAWWNWTELLSRLGRKPNHQRLLCLEAARIKTLPEDPSPILAKALPGEEFITYDFLKGHYLIYVTNSENTPPGLEQGQYHWDAWISEDSIKIIEKNSMGRIENVFPNRTVLLKTPWDQNETNPIAWLTDDQVLVMTGRQTRLKNHSDFQQVKAMTSLGVRTAWIKSSDISAYETKD